MIKSNTGISTKGVHDITLDGISREYIVRISKEIKNGRLKISPVRRVMIPKVGKTELRLLGVSSPREKIVQKALEIVLTVIFEKEFHECSHGFRPGLSCHTALKHIQLKVGNVASYS